MGKLRSLRIAPVRAFGGADCVVAFVAGAPVGQAVTRPVGLSGFPFAPPSARLRATGRAGVPVIQARRRAYADRAALTRRRPRP